MALKAPLLLSETPTQRLPLVGTDTSRFRMTSMGSYVFTWPGSTIEKRMGTSPMRILFSSFGCAALIHINL